LVVEEEDEEEEHREVKERDSRVFYVFLALIIRLTRVF